ncbi:MAG TPA: hypothetical protein VJC18_01865 [bacterium]|nr:hypothetical protein [bacterium]
MRSSLATGHWPLALIANTIPVVNPYQTPPQGQFMKPWHDAVLEPEKMD